MAEIALEVFLSANPDITLSGNARHAVSVESIVDGRGIEDYFQMDYVSYRDLFNNLDGDDRAGIALERRDIAGTVLTIASVHTIINLIDNDQAYFRRGGITELDVDELNDIQEEEFSQTLSAAMNNMCAYLFGRDVLHEDFSHRHPEVHETMYHVCEDILWYLVTTLASEVNQIEWIHGVLETDYNLHITSRWFEDYVMIAYQDNDGLPIKESTHIALTTRGLISNERFNHPHGSRVRHR